MRTHYTNLKVSENATQEEIKSAYKALAQKWHPDKNEDKKLAHRNFRIIKRSYEVLSNETRRAKHDAWIKKKREREVHDIALVSTAKHLMSEPVQEDTLGLWESLLYELGARRVILGVLGFISLLVAIGFNIFKAVEGSPVAIFITAILVAQLVWSFSSFMKND